MGIESRETRKNIGLRLQKIRQTCSPKDFQQERGIRGSDKGITRAAAALGIGISVDTLEKIEQGKYMHLNTNILSSILDYYGVDYALCKDIFNLAEFTMPDKYAELDLSVSAK